MAHVYFDYMSRSSLVFDFAHSKQKRTTGSQRTEYSMLYAKKCSRSCRVASWKNGKECRNLEDCHSKREAMSRGRGTALRKSINTYIQAARRIGPRRNMHISKVNKIIYIQDRPLKHCSSER
jgi:hypothetical protein